jgi:hypothetical protein
MPKLEAKNVAFGLLKAGVLNRLKNSELKASSFKQPKILKEREIDVV